MIDGVAATGPLASALYGTIYQVGWIIHAAFVAYVVGGTAYVAGTAVAGTDSQTSSIGGISPRAILVDWLPAMLSGAITAGIVPLLFVQILYRDDFYTANLLLFHRWMAIVPALIIGFYALYLLRRQDFPTWKRPLRIAISFVPLVTVLFTGYTWIENHLLSLRSAQTWVTFYGEQRTFYFEPLLPLRAVFFLSAFAPVMLAILGLQVDYHSRRGRVDVTELRSALARTALWSLAAAATIAVAFVSAVRAVILPERLETGTLLMAAAVLMQAWGWIRIGKRSTILGLGRFALVLTSAGGLLLLSVISLLREELRAQTLGVARLAVHATQQAAAFERGGLSVFLFFTVLNTVLIASCFVMVRRSAMRRR